MTVSKRGRKSDLHGFHWAVIWNITDVCGQLDLEGSMDKDGDKEGREGYIGERERRNLQAFGMNPKGGLRAVG